MSPQLKRLWPAALLVASAVGLSAQAPAPAQPTAGADRPNFSAQVDLITTNAIVRDDKGNFVADLTKDEFEIYEDSVKQDIASMTLSHGSQVTNLLTPPPAPPP